LFDLPPDDDWSYPVADRGVYSLIQGYNAPNNTCPKCATEDNAG